MSEVAQALDIAAQLEGARLIVVGGTGFLGKVWLAMLLHRYPGIGKIFLVVRAKGGRDHEARFWSEVVASKVFEPLREAHPGAAFEAFLKDKVEVIDADVSRPFCGIDETRRRELAGTIDALVNVAGVVDFNPPLDEALAANAFGVQNLVDLARALGDVPVLHTSTCYVAGYRSGQIDEVDPLQIPFPRAGSLERAHWDPAREIAECLDLIDQARHRADDAFRQSAFVDEAKRNLAARGEPTQGRVLEDEVARVRKRFVRDRLVEAGVERAKYWGWTNIYTYTKSIGEQILAASGLPYTIVRPAVIESSVAYPFPGWNEGINTMAPLVYLIMRGHIQIPSNPRTTLDVIPVDMVSAGMIAALGALLDGTQRPVYQLGSSDTNPLPMPRLIELCGLYKRKHYQRTGKGNPFVNFVQAHLEPEPVSAEGFYKHGAPAVAQAARNLSGVLEKAAMGPAAALLKPAAKALQSYASVAQRSADVWGMFIPFIAETEYRFSCAETRALFARITDEDRARLPWAPESIDWRHYMHEVHIPGLEKWVLPEIDEKARRPLKPLRAHETLLTLLDEMAAQHDLGVALQRFERDGLTRVSFREWRARAGATAARLAAAGVAPKDRVLLSGANHPDWPIAYFGILRAGAVAVPVDPGLDGAALANIARASGARAAIWDARVASGAGASARAECPELSVLDLHEATAPDEALVPPEVPAARGEDVASIIYTSGTTGTPKGVMLTHANFTSLLASLAPIFPLSPGDRALSVLPLHHTFEFTCGMLLPMSRGARVVYLDEINAERLSAAMREARITAMVGVPALWQLLERRIVAQVREKGVAVSKLFDLALTLNRVLGEKIGADVGRVLFGPVHDALGGNIRYMISGGAALPRETAKLFAGLGLHLAEGYGLTEAAPVLTVEKPRPGTKPGSVGKAIPGVEIKIDAPDASGVGEVLARGPNVMAGYANDSEATARAIDSEGWLHTGDLGRIDKHGALTIVGRMKDVIVSATGENVYPDDVERLLGEVPHVAEIAIVGISDPRGGERVACLYVPARAPEGAEDERAARHERAARALREALARLPQSARPAVVLPYDADLPRTATRKIKRAEVRTIIERLLAASGKDRGGDGATSAVRKALAALTNRDAASLAASTRLRADLGMDSLMAMELALALEAASGEKDLAGLVARAETVGELEAALGAVVERPKASDSATVKDVKEAPVRLPEAVKDLAKATLGLVQREFYGSVMRPKVTGRALIPHNRNTIVVANHASHLDMGLVKYALGSYGRDLVALAARDYFFEAGGLRRAFVENLTNLAPVDRNGGLRSLLRDAGAVLEQGKTVLIFPEGTRSPDGSIREFKPAFGHLALQYGVDVLPVYLGGTFEALPKHSLVPTRRDLVARIGPPLRIEDLRRLTEGMRPADAAREVARLAQRAVEALRDGGALDASTLEPGQLDGAERPHPLVSLFDELERRFIPGSVEQPVSFYFTLGSEPEAKWTVRVSPTKCEVKLGKPEGASADCVLKTSAEMFTRIVREGYQPGVPEFMSGAIRSNDVTLLQTFQRAFQLG